jgi:signal transduction histidine kinase
MTIRKKLTLLYSALVALTLIGFGVFAFMFIRASWLDALDSALQEEAQKVINHSQVYPVREFGQVVRWEVFLPSQDMFRASGLMVQAWRIEGDQYQLRAESANLGDYQHALDADMLGAKQPAQSVVRAEGVELRVLTLPVDPEGDGELWGNIQVAASMQTLNAATNKLALIMLVGGMAAVLASFILGLLLSGQALQPIGALTAAASNISTAKDLKTRLPWQGPKDELGQLVDVFNSMMNRIEHLFGAQQRLVADVSHELRTPLTTIRGNLDLVNRYGMDPTCMESIQSEVDRMSRMVEDLLTLARADYGSLQIDLSEIDLDAVVTDVYKKALVLVKDRDLTIKLAVMDSVRIEGNNDRLQQLLFNLVHNAIKFTPDGGTITLGLKREHTNTALLIVNDTGIGIESSDLDHIFERFYQADPARFRPSGAEGAGLGLAIARWIAEAHHGSISVASTPGKGSTFTIRLPTLELPVVRATGEHSAATVPSIVIPKWMRRQGKQIVNGK